MMQQYWHKQTIDKPLYPNLLWSRPENLNAAGKLLIIGGNFNGITNVLRAYDESKRAGIGSRRVILPDVTKKVIGTFSENIIFANSTHSGSFSKTALATLVESSEWADAVLLAGQFGKSSETSILIESFIIKNNKPLILATDSIEHVLHMPLIVRETNLAVVSEFNLLQKLTNKYTPKHPITSNLALVNFLEILHLISKQSMLLFNTVFQDNLISAYNGEIVTSKFNNDTNWHINFSSHIATWLAQQNNYPFEALSCAQVTYLQ